MKIVQLESDEDYIYEVKINDYAYRVTFTEDYYQQLVGEKVSAEELVKKSFEFLLEREGPGSILPEFDLPTIQKYFPEYENEISNSLEA